MCQQSVLFVCISAILCLTDSAPPSFITKCKPDDDKCVLESAKAAIPHFAKGLPEYNVQPADPLFVKSINASQGNLLFLLNDVTFVGLKNCEAKVMRLDVAKDKLYMHLLCSGKMDAQYELKGTVVFVPIEGSGPMHADLSSMLFKIEADLLTKTGDDGVNHWHIKTWSHTFELLEKSHVVFENLFNGNEVLGRAARELVENNSNDVIKEIGPNVVKAIMSKILKSINHLFAIAPVEDLSLE